MADKSSLRYDDFISSVQPDPSKPESTIMLSGFVGHGPEGQVRIYPDPTLGRWYDVPEDDVVHSLPIADSKLGGSYVWVRASAQITPGSAAPAAAAAAQPLAAAAGIQPTPATDCFVCAPLTQDCPRGAQQAAAIGVPQQFDSVVCWPTMGDDCKTMIGFCPTVNCCTWAAAGIDCMGRGVPQQPTPATHCFICPPHQTLPNLCTMVPACQPTPATICFGCPPPQTHQLHCPTQPVVCNIQPSAAHHCAAPAAAGVAPLTMNWCQRTSLGCAHAAQPGAQAAAMQPGPMDSPACPTLYCPTLLWCFITRAGCAPNGVFTPFGR
jgi:hypothetical protein